MLLENEIPNSALMREMVEVANAANRLNDALRKVNLFPKDFPKIGLEEIIESLVDLPKGTANGCRQPLYYAGRRLTRTRRKHILSIEIADEVEDELDFDDGLPLRREGAVDLALQALISAVSVALDEYLDQASETPDDVDELEPSAENPQDATIKDVIAKSISTENQLQIANSDAAKLLDMDQVEAELFLRSMRDVEITNRLARAELRFKQVVKSWYGSTARAFSNAGVAVRITGSAIRIGAGISKIAVRRWNDFWGNFAEFTINEIEETGKMIEDAGRYLEKPHRKPAKPATAPPVDPQVQKAAEKEAERLLKQNQPVPDDIAENVRRIDLSHSKFSNSSLLTNLNWLQSLDLWNTSVSDISGLENLTTLQALYFGRTKVSGISLLKNLTALQSLNLRGTKVSDISVLENLTALQSLNLRGTRVSDISVLENLTTLRSLDLLHTNVSEITALKNLANLQSLNFMGPQESKISTLNLSAALRLLDLGSSLSSPGPVTLVKDVKGRPDDWDRSG